MCYAVDRAVNFQVRCSQIFLRKLLERFIPSYSKWGSYTLLWYIRLPQMTAYMARLQWVVSHCSELNVVTFILASCSCADRLFLSIINSRYCHFNKTGTTDSIAPTECLKSGSCGKEIMKAVWKYFNLCSYRNSFALPPSTMYIQWTDF